jgi:hypothetical protein
MKIPRMTIRRLMLVVLVFAIGWWTVQTTSRWTRYRHRAENHGRLAIQSRSHRAGWIEAFEGAERLLKVDQSTRRDEDIGQLNTLFRLTYDLYDSGYQDLKIVVPVASSAPTGWDDRLRQWSKMARSNLSFAETDLAYHELLRQKYVHAMSRPWRAVPPDPPRPRYSTHQ